MSELCNEQIGTINTQPFHCNAPKGHQGNHSYRSPWQVRGDEKIHSSAELAQATKDGARFAYQRVCKTLPGVDVHACRIVEGWIDEIGGWDSKTENEMLEELAAMKIAKDEHERDILAQAEARGIHRGLEMAARHVEFNTVEFTTRWERITLAEEIRALQPIPQAPQEETNSHE